MQIYQYVIHVTAHASVYTLVLMSFDRYLAVVHPITSMTIRNVRNTSVALVVAWLIIVSANAPMLPVFQVRYYAVLDTGSRITDCTVRLSIRPSVPCLQAPNVNVAGAEKSKLQGQFLATYICLFVCLFIYLLIYFGATVFMH